MAAIGRTARGLRRTPGYRQPEPPRPRRQQPAEGASKRRPMRYKLFSLGAGLDMPLLIFILVLLAIGLPHEIAHGSLRLSLGNDTTEADVDYVIEKLPGIVKDLREMSALSAASSFQP